MEVADAQLAQVVEALADPVEGAGEPVGVADVADHRGSWNQLGRMLRSRSSSFSSSARSAYRSASSTVTRSSSSPRSCPSP